MLDQPRLDFRFSPNAADFHVDEVMRFDHHDDDHEHLVFKASKKGLATWELVKLISSHTGIKAMDIGYAGLKDKKATTSQYISIRKADYAKLKGFISSSISSHQQQQQQQHVVHLEQVGTSRKKIKIGDHDGNRFFVRLWNVDDATASLLDAGLDALRRHGMPNYFGIQRYGRDLDSHIKGKQILESSSSSSWAAGGATGSGNGNGSGSFGGFRDRKLNVMFVEAYQSFLFDCWLSARVELSKLAAKLSSSSSSPSLLRAGLHYWSAQDEEAAVQLMNSLFSPTTTASIATTPLLERLAMQEQFFKLLPGDVLSHYPIGKLFHVVNNENEQVLRESAVRFAKDRAVCPTGLLPGTKQHGSRWPAMHEAREIEKEFDFFASASSSLASAKFFAPESSRRFAWVFPEDIQGAYVRQGQGRNNNKGGCYEMSFYLPKGSYCTTLLDELKHDTSLDAKFHPLKRRRL